MQIARSNGWPELNVDANKAHCHGLKVRPCSPTQRLRNICYRFYTERDNGRQGFAAQCA